MTVIAYRDGIMAADTGSVMGNVWQAFSAKKVRRWADGSLAAASGCVPHIEAFHGWGALGCPPDALPFVDADDGAFGALVVRKSGEIIHYDHKLRSYPACNEWAIEGSHEEFLSPLMLTGMSAPDAIGLAIKHCVWAAGVVFALKLHEVAE